MVDMITAVLVGVRLVVLLLGVLITFYSYQAYQKTRAPYLRNASIGFGIITVGVFIEGVLFEFAGFDIIIVHLIESIGIGLGFAVLLISLRR
ncbi:MULTISPECIES: hypothetical protein [Haloferax]|uniref:YapH protein n=2 Tax=Haloferax TaxID=2251 RepID=A0A6G1Z7D6_9EURY|nr:MULTISPECIES: hypothetical protein [Haloferax]KAB1185134.1 hypothetical protein Hfx1149_16575 [Haloferax sp. CBA1149]MRW82311.1 hypothetical protein [Haloferax marinisediminis]